MQWKLGVAVSSSKCQKLSAPFVAVAVRVADVNGAQRTHHFELTVPEFMVRVWEGWWDGFVGRWDGVTAGSVSVRFVMRTFTHLPLWRL